MKHKKSSSYALVHFSNKKPIKIKSDTAAGPFFDYRDQGCILVELFNTSGAKMSSYPNKTQKP